MAQISDKMYNQNFQNAYYAANLYTSYFNDQTLVMANVLNIFTNTTQADIIYADREYGMNSTKALDIWMAAYYEEQVSPAAGVFSP